MELLFTYHVFYYLIAGWAQLVLEEQRGGRYWEAFDIH